MDRYSLKVVLLLVAGKSSAEDLFDDDDASHSLRINGALDIVHFIIIISSASEGLLSCPVYSESFKKKSFFLLLFLDNRAGELVDLQGQSNGLSLFIAGSRQVEKDSNQFRLSRRRHKELAREEEAQLRSSWLKTDIALRSRKLTRESVRLRSWDLDADCENTEEERPSGR